MVFKDSEIPKRENTIKPLVFKDVEIPKRKHAMKTNGFPRFWNP